MKTTKVQKYINYNKLLNCYNKNLILVNDLLDYFMGLGLSIYTYLFIILISVSALDVSVQAQVLNLLNQLKTDFNFTYIFISRDLAVVKYMSDQLVVMNKGKIEETGDAVEIYKNPQKEYTQALIDAIP